jgi:hypothetical protein
LALSRAMVFALLALRARNLLEEKDGLAVFIVLWALPRLAQDEIGAGRGKRGTDRQPGVHSSIAASTNPAGSSQNSRMTL